MTGDVFRLLTLFVNDSATNSPVDNIMQKCGHVTSLPTSFGITLILLHNAEDFAPTLLHFFVSGWFIMTR